MGSLSAAVRQADITTHDLREALRAQLGHAKPSRVRRAYLERNGKISFIPYRNAKGELRVCTVSVEKGVQTVRIEIK